jgi:hypothetical protein
MPKIVPQRHDDGGVMEIYSEQESRRKVRAGQNKWQHEIRDQIDVTWIGNKRFYSAEAINKYLRRQTKRARAGAS